MTEVRFYHLQRSTLEQALPGILEKVLERGWRAVVLAASKERVERLNQHLWTYHPNSFLPHGAASDGLPAEHPIWLTDTPENPNSANVLFLTDGMAAPVDSYTIACDLFDGEDPAAKAAARTRWRTLKEAGHDLTYWQQTERGWEKKAAG